MKSEKKNEKKLALILMIIAAIIVFFIGNLLGVILAIISLIISIKELKNKELLNKIAFVGSIIIILISILFFIISFNVINKTLTKAQSNAKETDYKSAEYKIDYYMEHYFDTMIRDNVLVDGKNLIEKEILDEYSIPYPKECDVYVVVNINLQKPNENTSTAYLKCDDYVTTGYDDNSNLEKKEDNNITNEDTNILNDVESNVKDNSWENGKFSLCEKEYTIKGYFSEMINNGWVYNYDNTDSYYNLEYGLDKDIKLTNANCDIDVSVSIINLSDKDIDIRNSEEIKKTQINKITAEIPYDSKDDFLLSNSISKNSNVSEIKKLWGNPKGEYDYDSSLFYYTYKTSFGKSLSLRIKTSDEKPYFFEFSFGI